MLKISRILSMSMLLAAVPVGAGVTKDVCSDNDSRTQITVWTPEIDKQGHLTSEPPMADGSIVYIELFADATTVSCNNDDLNAFSLPNDRNNPDEGGLAVNVRGNTQLANGICYFTGYYMNEQVMGMHQGWIETYFGAIDKQKITLSPDFCLSEKLP